MGFSVMLRGAEYWCPYGTEIYFIFHFQSSLKALSIVLISKFQRGVQRISFQW